MINLYQRVIKSGSWVLRLRITEQVLNFFKLVILARILVPGDFGLLGMAILITTALDTFSQPGFQQALIQKKESSEEYFDTAFTVSCLRGVFLFIIFFVFSPYLAFFFRTPQIKPILQVIGLSAVLDGFTNIGVVYFQKNLEFNKQYIYQISGTLGDFFTVIPAAFIFRNVWALVLGVLAGRTVKLLVSYLLHPYRPHFDLNIERAKALFAFGKWVMSSNSFVFIITQGDSILVGKILGTMWLGFYQMASRISNLLTTELSHMISQVTFPAYSKLQEDISKIGRAYLKTLRFISFFSAPLAAGIFAISPEFTKTFLGEKWMPMVPAMQILAIAGAIRSISATSGPLFYSVGKPYIDTVCQWIRLIVLGVFIYPFMIKWGISGVGKAVFLSISVSAVCFIYGGIRVAGINNIDFLKSVFFPFISSFAMFFILLLIKPYVCTGVCGVIILIVAGMLVYSIFIALSNRELLREIYGLAGQVVQKSEK